MTALADVMATTMDAEPSSLVSVTGQPWPPEGWVSAWVPETEPGVELAPPGWDRRCRYGVGPLAEGCGAPAVWRVSEAGAPGFERWAAYCAAHLFGRRIVSGVLLVAVLRAVA